MIDNFEEIIHPMTIEKFSFEYYGKKPLFIKNKDNRLNNLIDWKDLYSAINNPFYWNHDKLKIIDHKGCFIDYSEEANKSSKAILNIIENNIKQKNSLLINQFSHWNQRTLKISQNIEKAFNGFAHCCLLFSQPVKVNSIIQSNDTHSFIIICKGKKHWTIFQESSPFPLKGQAKEAEAENLKPEIDTIMEPGDFLYIPPYRYHSASAISPCLLLNYSEEKANVGNFTSLLLEFVNKQFPELSKRNMPHSQSFENYLIDIERFLDRYKQIARSEAFHSFYLSSLEEFRISKEVNIRALVETIEESES